MLSLAGTRPRSILFAYMLVACFASMWISNVAAPVLCYSLIQVRRAPPSHRYPSRDRHLELISFAPQPILRTLPSKSPFSKALILGIALASNVGGMASPISSPQNLIALDYMNPPISWLAWFSVSIPVSFLSVCLIWGILLWTYRAGTSTVAINPVRVTKEPFTSTQWWVSGVTIATILLWCVETKLAWLFGDMGIIAILPIVAFYGSGVLRKVRLLACKTCCLVYPGGAVRVVGFPRRPLLAGLLTDSASPLRVLQADFDHSPWSIVTLAMGGIALGKAVLSSGLLDDMCVLSAPSFVGTP